VQPTEADIEIEEEHLLNFVVNSLDEELAIDLGEDVEVTTETLYEVLAGASAGGTSINHVCETTDDSPHANTVRGHLTDQFDLDTVEAVGDMLLQRDALERVGLLSFTRLVAGTAPPMSSLCAATGCCMAIHFTCLICKLTKRQN